MVEPAVSVWGAVLTGTSFLGQVAPPLEQPEAAPAGLSPPESIDTSENEPPREEPVSTAAESPPNESPSASKAEEMTASIEADPQGMLESETQACREQMEEALENGNGDADEEEGRAASLHSQVNDAFITQLDSLLTG